MKAFNTIIMNTNDVSFKTEDNKRFRLRACGIVIENNCVLFATNSVENYYYAVGGGVEIGETVEDAVLREMFEETGINYEIDRLAFVHETFFKRETGVLKDLSCHEITFFFLMKSRGTQELNSNSYFGDIKEEMVWLPIDELSSYDIHPRFFCEKLKNLNPYVEHIISK